MRNCLKTQLKAVVENDNLEKLGEITFTCKVNSLNQFIINRNEFSGLRFIGNYSIDIISDTTTLSDGTKYYEGAGESIITPITVGEIFTIKIKSKYDFVQVFLNYTTGSSPTLLFLDAYQIDLNTLQII